MIKQTEITIHPINIKNEKRILIEAAKKIGVSESEITEVRILRRSIDSRKKPVYRLRVEVYVGEKFIPKKESMKFKPPTNKKAAIVGSGPAGLFAALRLLEAGIKPIIFERGKDVQARRLDLKKIQQEHFVNPDSNYCFGEGGAGTYSDGKLHTRSHKRGNVKRILEIFVEHGAQPEIEIDAHPHIGSNVLPKVVENIRETIIANGGEIHFNSKVTDLIKKDDRIIGVKVNEKEILTDAVIIAAGHSARDVYQMLQNAGALLEEKPFALGVRIEHPQKLIDTIQYHGAERGEYLPAASYNLSCQVDGRGVYSFCMCPGGIIIPAATSPDELVLNGMSLSRRNSPFANAGLVVEVTERDWHKYKKNNELASVAYQAEVEKNAFEFGGGNQSAPAQRVTDFLKRRTSSTLPETSYIPGALSAPLHDLLPKGIAKRLVRSIYEFDKKMKGYLTGEALLLAVESRTSAPIRVVRDSKNLMSVSLNGLFPSGEGSGYAGGIVSAAIDGNRTAEALAQWIIEN
ncbi:MAG: FAD-binding protein [Chlorobi bacterium]|nr:FAD-binding protein [Chlorobiota bacterium]